MARGHTSRIFASYAHELPYFEHFKGKKMKKRLLYPREVATWQREWGEENERNKPVEGKRVLCWTVIKKEKMGIKYIMGHRGK